MKGELNGLVHLQEAQIPSPELQGFKHPSETTKQEEPSTTAGCICSLEPNPTRKKLLVKKNLHSKTIFTFRLTSTILRKYILFK